MSVFINKESEFSSKLFVAPSKTVNGKLYCDSDMVALKDVAGDDYEEEKVQTYTFWFRLPTFQDTTKFIEHGIRMSTSDVAVFPAAIRQKRMTTLITKWNFTSDTAAVVPVTESAINNLHPAVAATIGAIMDKILSDNGLI